MAPNEKVGFHENVESEWENTHKKQLFYEKLITRGSMCGHFASGGLARGRM